MSLSEKNGDATRLGDATRQDAASPRKFAKKACAFFKTPAGIAIAAIVGILTIGSVLTAWFACDGLRSVVKVTDIKKLHEMFAVIIFGTSVIYSAIALALCIVIFRMTRRVEMQRQSMDEILRSILHSLASPLSKIRMTLDLLCNGIGDPISASQKAIRQLDALIDLVTLRTEIQHNRNRVELVKPQVFDVVEAIRSQIERYRVSGQSRGITAAFNLPDAPLTVLAHPAKVTSLIDNLVSNAIKYNKPGGTVTVTVSNERRNRKGNLKIVVADTGIGMSSEDQERMYEEFFRADNGVRVEGTGMGLPLVQSIVMYYEGEIECRSALGKGTTFTVLLPIAKEDA